MRTHNLVVAILLLGAVPAQRPQLDGVPQRPPAGCTPSPGAGSSFVQAPASAWTNGIVPFTYAANVTPAMQAAMAAAMNEITSRVRVQFVPHALQPDFVVIRDSTINSSPIGRIVGGQFLDIANWNSRFEMVHELLHVLGFWHEHQRPDRNTFVQIQFANVDPLLAANFQLVPVANTFGFPYDFDSVTHFAGTEGGIGGATTIVVLPPNQAQQGAIGQRTHLSQGDIDGLRRVYGSLSPPTLASVTPPAVPSYLPPAVLLGGSLLDEVSRVRMDGVSIPFTVLSPTQVRANVPSLSTIGPHQLTVESGAGSSAALPIAVTANDPPVLFGPGAVSRNIAVPFRVYSDATRTNVLLAAPDNLPSVSPGILSLGIGNNFTTVFEVTRGIGIANGEWTVNLRAPSTMPAGLHFWLQSVVYDPANIQLPLSSSNVLAVTVF